MTHNCGDDEWHTQSLGPWLATSINKKDKAWA